MPIPLELNGKPFIEYTETIKMLYEVDEDFRSLCDDYHTSIDNTEKHRKESIKDMRSEWEYQQLTMELQNEILDFLKKLR